jgi:hypothetical protein
MLPKTCDSGFEKVFAIFTTRLNNTTLICRSACDPAGEMTQAGQPTTGRAYWIALDKAKLLDDPVIGLSPYSRHDCIHAMTE